MNWSRMWVAISDIQLARPTYMWAFYSRLLAGFRFAGKRVLELGCGTGFNSLMMAKEGGRVTLLDTSKEALSIAKRNFARHGLKARFVERDALWHGLTGFDVVHSEGLVEHFRGPQRQAVIDSHARAVRKGGYVLIIVPNRACGLYRLGKWLGEKTRTWPWAAEWPYSRAELELRTKMAGLVPEKVEAGEMFSALFWPLLPLWARPGMLKRVLSAPAGRVGTMLNYGLGYGRVLGIVARKR